MGDALLIYAVLLSAIWAVYVAYRMRREDCSRAVRDAAVEAGLFEPASLHPKFDSALCRGCGACARACPEGNVIGIINGKAALIEPSQCIGHGACRASCPFGAITLVFGTETRGVDIPHVRPNFETNIPGIFIAGELGGMGLIRNAIEQGRQAVASICHLDGLRRPDQLDLVIIGAGPAGLSASLAAREKKLRSVTIEQDSLGGTVAHFPRGKVVMTSPATLPIVGKVKFRETTKEKLLSFWQRIVRDHHLPINYEERVDRIEPRDTGFQVFTTRNAYKARAVLLAIGRRGTPRRLGVPGEELPKVVYRLSDPAQYRGQRVIVVGGGDSAIEAAVSIAEEPGTQVTISYRSEAFARAKMKNRKALELATASGRLDVRLKSNIKAIGPEHVEIEQDGRLETLANDAVIVCAGGILPTGFLKSIGIEVETKHGTA
jgi:putative YpdA family bacillithiol system oxidoreductase